MKSIPWRKFLWKVIKISLWTILGLVLLLSLLILTPPGQNFLVQSALYFLNPKFEHPVRLDDLYLNLYRGELQLQEIFVPDHEGDTLLYAQNILADINTGALWGQTVEIQKIQIQNLQGHVYRNADSLYNFQHLIAPFASEEPSTEQDTTSSSWAIRAPASEVLLEKIRLHYEDQIARQKAVLITEKLLLEITDLHVNENKYHLGNLDWNQAYLSWQQGKTNPPPAPQVAPENLEADASASSFALDLQAPEINLEQIQLFYQDQNLGQMAQVELGQLQLIPQKFDLNQQIIRIQKVHLAGANLAYAQDNLPLSPSADTTSRDTISQETNDAPTDFINAGWQIQVADLHLENHQLQYDDHNFSAQDKGVDYNHIKITDLNLRLKDFEMDDKKLEGNLNAFHFQEKSGLQLKTFQSQLYLSPTAASLQNFRIETKHSRIEQDLAVSYPSLLAIGESLGEIELDWNLKESLLSLKDARLFAPSIDEISSLQNLPQEEFQLKTQLQGKVKNLQIENLQFKGLNQTNLQAKGQIKGLPTVENTFFDLKADLNTGQADLRRFLPSSLSLPPQFRLAADYQGSIESFQARADLQSPWGDVETQAEKKAQNYQIKARTRKLAVGKIIQDTLIGPLSTEISLEGQGLDIEQDLKAQLDLKVLQAFYQGFEYNNLTAHADIDRLSAQAEIQIRDSVIVLGSEIFLDMNAQKDTLALDLLVDSLDLRRMGLIEDTLLVATQLSARVKAFSLENLSAQLSIHNLRLEDENTYLVFDTIYANTIVSENQSEIRVRSEYLQADIQGDFNPFSLSPVLTRHLNHYYQFTEIDSTSEQSYEPQQFAFEIRTQEEGELLRKFLPDLRGFDLGDIEGEYNSTEKLIRLETYFWNTTYENNQLDTLQIKIKGDQEKLDYLVALEQFKILPAEKEEDEDETVIVRNIRLEGEVAENQVQARLKGLDQDEKERLSIGLAFTNQEDLFRFRFMEPFIIKYEPWEVKGNNTIEIQKENLAIDDIHLQNGEQSIQINQYQSNGLVLNIQNLDLNALTRVAEQDSSLVGGKFNLEAKVQDLLATPLIEAEADIQDLSALDLALGNLRLQANNLERPEKYDLALQLSGNQNDLQLAGFYALDSSANQMDLRLDVNPLQVNLVQPLLRGNVEDLEGQLQGGLRVQGNPLDLRISGDLRAQDAKFKLTALNSPYHLNDEQILFDEQGIHFDQFTILDSLDNPIYLDGDILTQNYTDFAFNLDLDAEDFTFLNSTEADNEAFYGVVTSDMNVKVRGDLNLPQIQAQIRLKDKTDFTYVLLEGENVRKETEGIVNFVDKSQKTSPEPRDTSVVSEYKGIDVDANIIIEDDSRFKALLTAYDGGEVSVAGGGTLSFVLNPNGVIDLTGTYNIREGYYEIKLFEVIRRKLNLLEGSSITWTGNVGEPQINLKTIYTVATPPQPLFTETDAQYQVNQVFVVGLNLEGDALNPRISFDLYYPESTDSRIIPPNSEAARLVDRNSGNTEINSRVDQLNQDESELNKQVFALMVFGRFISSGNAFASGGGSSNLRGSLSQVLSTQLNKLSDKFVKGVNINFDLQSYEDVNEEGEVEGRTELNVDVSKSLFNNRVTVKVGETINLEGEDQDPGQGVLAADVVVEYKITKDGTYRLKIFNQDERAPTSERVNASGLSILFTKDYNKLKNLFKRKDRLRKRARKNQEEDDDDNDNEEESESNTKAKKQQD